MAFLAVYDLVVDSCLTVNSMMNVLFFLSTNIRSGLTAVLSGLLGEQMVSHNRVSLRLVVKRSQD